MRSLGRVVSITVCMSWAEVIDHREAELGAVRAMMKKAEEPARVVQIPEVASTGRPLNGGLGSRDQRRLQIDSVRLRHRVGSLLAAEGAGRPVALTV